MGSLVMIKGFPCKITELNVAKNGKHGACKVILKGKDIMTSKVHECTYQGDKMVDAPIVKKTEYTLANLDGAALELLDSNFELKADVNLPEEDHLRDIAEKIEEIFRDGKKEC